MDRLKSEGGFTLMEMLVVVTIVSILASIAITQFVPYRRKSFVTAVESDLRNVAAAQEFYSISAYTYKTCNPCTAADLPEFNPTPGVTVKAVGAGATFTLTGMHSSCGADAWTFDSSVGKITDDGTPCY